MRYYMLCLSILVCNNLPAQKKVDKQALDSLIKTCYNSHSESVTIIFDGKKVFDYSKTKNNRPVACYSVLKSIASLAVGKLIADSKIKNLDQPVCDYYPEWKQDMQSTITVRQLLNHTSGIEYEERDFDFYNYPDLVKAVLASKIIDTPGTRFLYNNRAFLLLLGVIGKASGVSTSQYIEQSLLKPLGIKNYRWDHDSAGNVKEFYSTSSELVKIGTLVLNNGKWESRQIVREEWVKESLQQSQPFVADNGLMWWLIPETTHYIVDDELLDEFRTAGVKQDVIYKFKLLKGDYVNENIPAEKLKSVFGEEWLTYLNKEFYPYFPVRSRRNYGSKIVGYKAEGYLGQYIVIYPEKKLVAARMVKNSDKYKIETDEMLDFSTYVYKLVK